MSDDSTLIPQADDRPIDLLPIALRPGDRVGRFVIRQVLGEGGFGIVFEAEQTDPVKRRIALKVIKPGMDSKGVVARFEAERQALALMDHPNVARVFDGGMTERGLPYFAMELVKGEPIHQFCDRHRLSIDERLKLMMKVCAAVQHAHAKGVIHRDLKPANILVSYGGDEEPSPKVIDFGVAKAINQPLTEATIFTERGQLIGTPEYMSPEQAEMGATDIDTRADVYSLGVLLYELLTGSRPFEAATLRKAGFDEIRRIIREVDPPKPSTRLSSLVSSGEDAETVTRIAKARRTEMRSLTGTLRRDLDWLVMKCLEKNRDRRYDTATALAMELQRYLANEPVLAGPPSMVYRIRKFTKRNRAGVIAASCMSLMLIAATALSSRWATLANHARDSEAAQRALAVEAETAAKTERDRAVKEEQNARAVLGFFRDAFVNTQPNRWRQPSDRGRPWRDASYLDFLEHCSDQAGDEFVGKPEVKGEILSILGSSLITLGELREGAVSLQEALEWLPTESITRAETQLQLAQSIVLDVRASTVDREHAIGLLRDALPVLREEFGTDSELALRAELVDAYARAFITTETGAYYDSDDSYADTQAIRERIIARFGPDHPLALMATLRDLAAMAAVPFSPLNVQEFESHIDRSRATLGDNNIIELFTLGQLTIAYGRRGMVQQEIATSKRLIEVVFSIWGQSHDQTAIYMEGHLAMLAHHRAWDEIRLFREQHGESWLYLKRESLVLEGFIAYLEGRLMLDDGDEAGADNALARAVDAWDRCDPENHRVQKHMATCLRLLAQLRRDRDLLDRAHRWPSG